MLTSLLLLKMSVESVLGDHKEKGKMFCSVACREEYQWDLRCALEMVEMEFFNVTIAMDDHNEDSVSVLQLKAKILESIRIRMLKK